MYTACVHIIVENTTKGEVVAKSLGDIGILNMGFIHFWICFPALTINSHIFMVHMVQGSIILAP